MIGLLVVVAIAAASCGLKDRSFEADERVRIVTPRRLQVVKPPFTIRWTGDVAEASRYAVFIDRAPIAPGTSLREFAERECGSGALCPPDTAEGLAGWLAQRGIFEAKSPRLEVPFVTAKGVSTEKDTRDTHEATVVLLDHDGRRIGESAWATKFRVPLPKFDS